MRNMADALLGKEAVDQRHIADISFNHKAVAMVAQSRGIVALDGGVVKVVEVIDDHDAFAASQQFLRGHDCR